MKITNDLLKKLVVVKFLDHSAFTKELCTCQVVGWVAEVGDKHISVAWWDLLDEEDEDIVDENREYCSVIISAIEELRVIELSTSCHQVPS